MKKRKESSLQKHQQLAAIVWAADQKELSYGKYMMTLNERDLHRIYQAYQEELARRKAGSA